MRPLWRIGAIVTRPIQFSEYACDACGFRHQVDAFKAFQFVRVVIDEESIDRQAAWHGRIAAAREFLGMIGVVMEWRCYNGPVWVRVQFSDGRRANLDPCMLEHVTVSEVAAIAEGIRR